MLAVLAVLASAVPATAAMPRVVITGDSMGMFLEPPLGEALDGRAIVSSDIHYGTGLTSPRLFSWLGYPKRQVKRYQPDVIIASLGTADKHAIEGARCCHRPWMRRYAKLIKQLTRRWRRAGVTRVYWLGLPEPGGEGIELRGRVHAVNRALRRARVPVINTRPILTPDGVFVRDAETSPGVVEQIRWNDGVHITAAGQRLVAPAIAKRLADDGILR